MKEQIKNDYDFADYEGMSPAEVLDTYVVGIGVKEDLQIHERQALIIFIKMVLNEELNGWQIAILYKSLGYVKFQRIFVLVIGSLQLVLLHIEAYKLLAQIQNTINKMASHKTLSDRLFWDNLPIKPKQV